MLKWTVAGFWLCVLVGLTWFSLDHIPRQHNPFLPLKIEDPLGLATRSKIAGYSTRADACYDVLQSGDIHYTALQDTDPDQPCGFRHAVTLERSLFPYSSSLQMTCPLTVALSVWERQSIVLRAKQHLTSPVVRILSAGSYNCRRLYGRATGKYSEHARANAIDIKGFELADGRKILLVSDWEGNTDAARFLKDIRDDACRIFGTVLGPDYNAAHKDHFHFDQSQTGVCR